MNQKLFCILLLLIFAFSQSQDSFHFTSISSSKETPAVIIIFWGKTIVDTVQLEGSLNSGEIENSEITPVDYNFDGYMDFIFQDILSINHGTTNSYFYLFDPLKKCYSLKHTTNDLLRITVSVKDSSFTEYIYMDYFSCYDTLIHYRDTVIGSHSCDTMEMDF